MHLGGSFGGTICGAFEARLSRSSPNFMCGEAFPDGVDGNKSSFSQQNTAELAAIYKLINVSSTDTHKACGLCGRYG